MPVFTLDDELIFPHPLMREPDGLLAVGGDLSPERLTLAYRWGIFPWYHDGQPLLWWWTCPRLMLRPQDVHISHSVRNYINRRKYTISIDQHFEEVIRKCSMTDRRGQDGTWITADMIDAYTALFRQGIAHSVEVRDETGLVGGLYGVAIGKIFSGESMFAEKPNASKIGFVFLANHLAGQGFDWIDCQQDTTHMRSMGGKLIMENEYLEILRANQYSMLKSSAPQKGD